MKLSNAVLIDKKLNRNFPFQPSEKKCRYHLYFDLNNMEHPHCHSHFHPHLPIHTQCQIKFIKHFCIIVMQNPYFCISLGKFSDLDELQANVEFKKPDDMPHYIFENKDYEIRFVFFINF